MTAMTSSWAGGPPTAISAVEAAPFVVRTVRSAIRRRFCFVVGVQVAVALLVVALLLVLAHLADGALGALGLAPFLLLLLSVGFQVGLWCYTFGARAAISFPLTLTTEGPVFAMPQGTLAVPWAAVAQLRLRSVVAGSILRFHPHPAVTVDGPGVSTDLSPRDLGRQLRRGLQIGSVGIDRDLEQLVVVAEQLAGRPLRTR